MMKSLYDIEEGCSESDHQRERVVAAERHRVAPARSQVLLKVEEEGKVVVSAEILELLEVVSQSQAKGQTGDTK